MIFQILSIGFAALAIVSLAGAWLQRTRRVPYLWAASCAAIAGGAAFYQVFWPVAVFGLMVVWALIVTLPTMTTAWRMKTGLTTYIVLGCALALYPTYHDESLCPEGPPPETLRDTCPRKIDSLGEEERAVWDTAAKNGDHGPLAFVLSNLSGRMVRGLDLKGGLRLVYTVDVAEALKDKRDRYYDELRIRFTKAYGFFEGDGQPKPADMQKIDAKVELTKPRDHVDTILLSFKSDEAANECLGDDKQKKKCLDEQFLLPFSSELNVVRSENGREASFKIRSDVGTHIRDSAVSQAKETINRRIDGLGVKEASISVRDEDIIVEIPGGNEKEFQQIRDIISQTARLEFKMLDDDKNFFESLVRAEAKDLPAGLQWEQENAPVGQGKSQANVYPRLRALPGEKMDPALERFRKWAASLDVDQDHEIGFGRVYDVNEDTDQIEQVGWRAYFLWAKADVTGDMVRDAQARPDQSDTGLGGWNVMLNFTPKGAEIFENVTAANVKRRFAIILDSKVESAPVINEKIGGGSARITMGAGSIKQQLEDARKLELVLRSGALPAPISPSNEQRIGPSLGRDAISDGVKAAGIGSACVLILMLLFYRKAGVITNLAVLFNLVLQISVLAMFGASMTLPGICGLALTVGMSVDANVLINERIRDELRAGKSARSAVQLGYDRAFSAILDGNVTTLISALILAQYGTGPIKGFAVTLIIGMICNLFTGVVVTRLFFEFWVRKRSTSELSIGA